MGRGILLGLWAWSLTACGSTIETADATSGAGSTDSAAQEAAQRVALAPARALAAAQGERVLLDPAYVASREVTRGQLRELDERAANELDLNPAERVTFLGVMDEHRSARLELQDALVRRGGSTRAERTEALSEKGGVSPVTLERASAAFLRKALAEGLGQARTAAYFELVRRPDTWRFKPLKGTAITEAVTNDEARLPAARGK
jgi:hypothetical protein